MSKEKKVPESLMSLAFELQKKKEVNENIEVQKSKLVQNSINGSILYDEGKQGIERGVVYIDVDEIEPAPHEWDFWSNLSEDDYNDLKLDIYMNGLDVPIKLWKRHNSDKYMLISGKHRWKIYNDLKQTNFEKYSKIPATIETEETMGELDVRDRIIALNNKGRKITPLDHIKAGAAMYKIYKEKSKRGEGSPMKSAAQSLNISSKQLQRYLDCDTCIPQYQEMFDNDTLSINNGVKLSKFSHEDQLWIYETFNKKLQNKYLKELIGTMSRDEVTRIFTPIKQKKTTVNYAIPNYLKDEFDEYVKKWLISKNVLQTEEGNN